MTEPTLHPSRLLKIVAGLARWSMGLMLAFWLLLTLAWGGLHGWIVPRIGEFRPQLEAQASRLLGVPVRVGALAARTEGLIPSVELVNVALLDREGRTALQLPRVVVALSPRSLLAGGFSQLYLESPQLDIRRLPDGRLTVAGLALPDTEGDGRAIDWIFSQGEVLIENGTLRWTDEMRRAPPLELTAVNLVLRNGNWRHQLRIDATPAAAWGDRFTLRGMFRAPLLQGQGSHWQTWSGQLYAHFSRVDVSRLRQHADVAGVDVARGHGALRAWADVQRGQIVGGVADLALADVSATLGPELAPLALASIEGRLGGRRLQGGFEFSTQALQFATDDGLVWPGGNLLVRYTEAAGRAPAQGEVRADRLDLAALAQIASRLPLSAAARQGVATLAPRGMVDEVAATWKGPLDALQQYQLRGRIQGLALAADAPAGGLPGLRGATVDVDMTQGGGRATLAITDGALVLPGVFEEPVLPLDHLNAEVRWQIEGQRIALQTSQVRFGNADAEGEARLSWQTSDVAPGSGLSRFPGVLDLSGTLTRADGTRVHRYLPLSIDADARRYVRDAVVAGKASQVQFKVRGNLNDLPFDDPRTGEFRIAARVKDVTYAYVPPRLLPPGTPGWPALTQLEGELIFDRSSMQVRGASASFAGLPGLRLARVEARIPDLSHTVVTVSADARGPLTDMLALVHQSPLADMTGQALRQAAGTGNSDLQLRLTLPISDMNASRVQGQITLAGNEVRITPDTPVLSRVRGAVQFSETGFTLSGVQARALGGEVRIEGGMRPASATPVPASPPEAQVQLRAVGVASAEGLQQARQLGLLSQWAQKASGSAAYTLDLGFRRGVPELRVVTTLQGMALALPAPLGKAAEASTPLRFESQVLREPAGTGGSGGAPAPLRDQLSLDWAGVGVATYQREWGETQATVLRGAVGLGPAGTAVPPLPSQGVAAHVQLGDLDMDAWDRALADLTPGQGAERGSALASTYLEYLPHAMAVQARSVTAQGYALHGLVAGGVREGAVWRASVRADELNGYLEYQPGGAPSASGGGRVFARLASVQLPQSEVQRVESLLDAQPGNLPSLDIVAEDVVLRGRKLGRVSMEAQNRVSDAGQREWRLARLSMEAPDAVFTATGNWAQPAGSPSSDKRTALDFRWDIRDSGELLARFGMPDVVRRGKGRLEGDIAWRGAPFSPDYRSMTGQVQLNIEAGQFLKADPGLAKLLSVLSLQSLPRRLTLDFRDVFSEGFAFDFVRGDVRVDRGVATTNNLQMKGVNAAVLMEGSAHIERETQDLRVVVVPEINAMTASLVATAINPVVGLGSFLAQVFLRGPLIEAATQEFHIDGAWDEPRVVRVPRRGRVPEAVAPAGSADPSSPASPTSPPTRPGALP